MPSLKMFAQYRKIDKRFSPSDNVCDISILQGNTSLEDLLRTNGFQEYNL